MGAGADPALESVFVQQQVQKGSLAAPVPAHKAQIPIRIHLKTDVLKHVLVTAFVSETEIAYLNDRHGVSVFGVFL